MNSFSLTDRVIFGVLVGLTLISSIYLIHRLSRYYSVEVPIKGGTLIEGVVGPLYRHINPVLVITDAGRDLTQLIYSGLMKATPEGKLIPDLAESYTISEDRKMYTFKIRDNAVFHDGTPVTADDIIFTIDKTQDPVLQSSKRPNFAKTIVQKIDEKTVQFILSEPYAPFMENTTIGILPKHIWKNVSSDQFQYSPFNEKPIGSGPYMFDKVIFDSISNTPEQYNLIPFKHYTLGAPYISEIIIKFYQNEASLIEAFKANEINSMYGISPNEVEKVKNEDNIITTANLPRVFGLFFNQNQNTVLASKEVRKALKQSINKEELIEKALVGYAEVIDGPIPPGYMPKSMASTTSTAFSIDEAKKILSDAGWTIDEEGTAVHKKNNQTLQFSIATSDAPELVQIARMVQSTWQELGAQVEVKIFASSELNQTVIRPRRFDILLFGEIIGRDLDLYAFWHSTQRSEYGLNITQYVNLKVDGILTKARTLSNMDERIVEYEKFEQEIRSDIPAIFLYSPKFIYVIPDKLKGVNIGSLTIPAERFVNIQNWYIETDYVWKIFNKK